jgi:hypothetical protein
VQQVLVLGQIPLAVSVVALVGCLQVRLELTPPKLIPLRLVLARLQHTKVPQLMATLQQLLAQR